MIKEKLILDRLSHSNSVFADDHTSYIYLPTELVSLNTETHVQWKKNWDLIDYWVSRDLLSETVHLPNNIPKLLYMLCEAVPVFLILIQLILPNYYICSVNQCQHYYPKDPLFPSALLKALWHGLLEQWHWPLMITRYWGRRRNKSVFLLLLFLFKFNFLSSY